MSIFFNNLISLAEQRGLSIRAISDGAGLPPSTLSRYVKKGPGARARTATIAAVAKFFDIPAEDLASKELFPPVSQSVLKKIVPSSDLNPDLSDSSLLEPPTLGTVPLFTSDELLAHVAKSGDISVEDLDSVERMVAPPAFEDLQTRTDLLAYRVQNDALHPIIPRGSIVYFRALEKDETPPNGSYVIAETRVLGSEIHEFMDDAPFVTVRKFSTDECYRTWLTATNPDFPEKERTILGGKIFGIVLAWSAKA